jgi:hypothetical protein
MKRSSRSHSVPGAVLLIVTLALTLRGATENQSSTPSVTENFDGPAELPREYVKNSLKDTPARGKTRTVHPGDSLEDALDTAACGDTLLLQSGAVFSGNFVVPDKNCDDSHWIIIRTSAPDASLPAEGTRLTPCYAGVPSLPGRPPLNCASTTNVLAKIEFNGKSGSGPITFATGANHYRLIGLEITRAALPVPVYNLIQFNGTADHLVFDRLWVHGAPQLETVRGILLGASRYVAIVDSFFTDFHCIAKSGSCGDTQTIGGGLGDKPMGPYKIGNNFLEASGENILFGGGSATQSPADIEIRRNHMFKPLIWMRGQTGYIGAVDGNPFIVKNLLELKNAQRVLIEGNILENSWGGFSQVGYAILLTPKNQGGRGGINLCPACQVTDVTIRYTSIRHVAAGLQIANAMAGTGAPHDGQRYSIHDLAVDDIDGGKYGGPGNFAQLSVSAGAPLLQNVTINHVTAFPPSMLFMIGDMVGTSGPIKNFVFTNSIVNAGTHPVWSTGGGPANCAFHNSPLATFSDCFTNSNFASNAILATPATPWPSGNSFPTSAAAVKFANYNGGNGGDYHLQASSPYQKKGSDGKDLGADIDAIHSATAGVE